MIILISGAWICLNKIINVKPQVLSVCAQLMAAIYDAMRASKGAVLLHTEEVQLQAEGACFAVIDTGIKVRFLLHCRSPPSLMWMPCLMYVQRVFHS